MHSCMHAWGGDTLRCMSLSTRTCVHHSCHAFEQGCRRACCPVELRLRLLSALIRGLRCVVLLARQTAAQADPPVARLLHFEQWLDGLVEQEVRVRVRGQGRGRVRGQTDC